MTEEEILEHNKNIFDVIRYNNDDIEKLHTLNNTLMDNIVAPCEYCHLDGMFRCEACKDQNYAGFKIDEFSQWK